MNCQFQNGFLFLEIFILLEYLLSRPKWTKTMTKQELIALEQESFAAWRRSLAEIEKNEKVFLTPFEKNIEVWRELWRVVERSEIIIQIVDARNPLLFRSVDLENWIHSFGKKSIILMNKSDLLTERQRQYWADYFKKQNVTFIFFFCKN